MKLFGPIEDDIPIPDEGPRTIEQALKELSPGQSRLIRMEHAAVTRAIAQFARDGVRFKVRSFVEGDVLIHRVWRLP